jgi:hypothetical protein
MGAIGAVTALFKRQKEGKKGRDKGKGGHVAPRVFRAGIYG